MEFKNLQLSINEEQKKLGQITRDADIYKKRIETRNNGMINLCGDLNICRLWDMLLILIITDINDFDL